MIRTIHSAWRRGPLAAVALAADGPLGARSQGPRFRSPSRPEGTRRSSSREHRFSQIRMKARKRPIATRRPESAATQRSPWGSTSTSARLGSLLNKTTPT